MRYLHDDFFSLCEHRIHHSLFGDSFFRSHQDLALQELPADWRAQRCLPMFRKVVVRNLMHLYTYQHKSAMQGR